MRVLLAEDEKRMAAALAALLKQEKYDVDHMEDGISALAALESGVYDIAVLDVMMPGMNGFEVARRARGKGNQDTHPDADSEKSAGRQGHRSGQRRG